MNNQQTVLIAVFAPIALISIVGGLMFGCPAYARYQARQDSNNEVIISSIEIRNSEQHVEIEKRKAEVRVEEAKGIAESQKIIASSLNTNYLQYLAIKAQEKMASSQNHTQIYIPSGANGIPLVKTVDVKEDQLEKK